MPEVGRPSNFQGITQEKVVAVGVAMVYDAEQPWVAGCHSKDAHVLGPAVPEDVFVGEEDLIAQPFIHNFVE